MRLHTILLAVLLSGCHLGLSSQPTCAPKTSRCSSNFVELCSPNGQWLIVMDCSGMGTTWRCEVPSTGPTCMEHR